MNRIQLEHIIRAASQISGDSEIVVIGSQAIHAQTMKLPPIAFQSIEADIYPCNQPDRADQIDAAIGELSAFHDTHGYYAHGIGPETAILPAGWQQRLIRFSNENTGGGAGEGQRVQPRAYAAWHCEQAEAYAAGAVDAS
jgi:hypothetical protein